MWMSANTLLLLLTAVSHLISAEQNFCSVNGYRMAYEESGKGDPIVFLHGNPTSSYLWRNIIPNLESRGRCIAPDLIGMGASDKLNNSGVDSYRFVEHAEFLDGLLECVLGKDEQVTLVVHDWGSALGFWWAYRNSERVKGIVYMEAIVMPLSFDFFGPEFKDIFVPLRTPEVGETLILEQNLFVDVIFPQSFFRNLTQEELDAYREPYLEPGEGRRPTLTWPREVPLDGEPADVASIVQEYSDWMASNDIPKLLIVGEPGVLLAGDNIPLEFARTWKNQTETKVIGIHFLQEDSPQEISDNISEWMDAVFMDSDTAPSTESEASSANLRFWTGCHCIATALLASLLGKAMI